MRTNGLVSRAARRVVLAAACLVTGCGGSQNPVPERPKSAQEHLLLAARCEDKAAEHLRAAVAAEQRPDTYVCADGGMPSQTTSGGERLTIWSPCWSQDRVDSAAHREEAERLRAEAAQHRATARTLLDVERTFCAGLPEDELTHTPFHHQDDIELAVAEREGDRIVGAKITFKPVPGLDAAWMRMALRCHRARLAALGYPATYMSYDPSMLLNVAVEVDDRDGPVVVTVKADDEVDGAVAWSRASALICAPKDVDGQ